VDVRFVSDVLLCSVELWLIAAKRQSSNNNHQDFQVPKMEVLTLTRLFQGLGYLHFYVPKEMFWW